VDSANRCAKLVFSRGCPHVRSLAQLRDHNSRELHSSYLARGQQTTSPADPSFKTEGHKSQKQHKKKASRELSDDQRDWLNNDVPYIITAAERAAYLQLGTNEERDQFIEHFWDLRKSRAGAG